MAYENVDLEYQILEEMRACAIPIGASYLALKLNAAQATIGRIMQKLEFNGYTEKSSNKGRMLTENGRQYLAKLKADLDSEKNASTLLNLFSITDRQVYLDVLQTRILLELYTVRQATLVATEEQLQELSEILERQAIIQRQGGLGEQENLTFHSKIAEYAGNKVIGQLLHLIMTQKSAYLHFSLLQYRIAERNQNDHFTMLQAMKDRNADLAVDIMNKHLTALIDDSKKIEYSSR